MKRLGVEHADLFINYWPRFFTIKDLSDFKNSTLDDFNHGLRFRYLIEIQGQLSIDYGHSNR
jgi:hypothetical protein